MMVELSCFDRTSITYRKRLEVDIYLFNKNEIRL